MKSGAASAHFQMQQLNQLLKDHNINLSNYAPDFFEKVGEEEHGDQLKEQTVLGALFLSLQDGSFQPNKDLGER